MKRQAAAVLEQGDHGRGALVVLRGADPRWRLGGEHLAAQPAAQPLQRVDLRPEGAAPVTRTRTAGSALQVDLARPAPRGRDRRAAGWRGGPGCRAPGVVRGPVAAVARGAGARACRVARGPARRRSGRRSGRAPSSGAAGPSGWSRCAARRSGAAPAPGWWSGLQSSGQTRQGLHGRLEGGVFGLAQRARCGSARRWR